MRQALIIRDSVPVNLIVLADGAEGDALLSDTCVEITDLDPRPALGTGWSYVDGEFVPPTVHLSWDDVRGQRDALLAASDWTQVADAPVDATAWAVYRQQLRDIPQTFDDPDQVVWPEEP